MDTVRELALGKTSVSISAASILALYVCYHLVSTYWKLRDIPGPFLAKFTDFQRMFWVKTMRGHEIHSKIHDKYGEVVRVGPNTVSLADPADIPALYPMRSGFPKVCRNLNLDLVSSLTCVQFRRVNFTEASCPTPKAGRCRQFSPPKMRICIRH